ncbi:MAG: 3-dehydroquinate synthase [Limnothrix sp.]|uniref:3-dehydroquinate synthase n=1 Tax=unclassified Limnothrix TaxID=2632864 RepID=UPI00081DD11A|nr:MULTISPECIES: 3-dehydroquinate synthase [unclassified Limnothrix]MEB3119524.1 3-dehydroquinate synthase [Limnothrix sp.]OCQ94569.1 3-dehydroquinate synthase [Limnothrix sp. P13C2]MBD2161805.1 3-dehydroquinate synthase [Limnothrix sp. FACHB-1083]MBD2192618.1 3-dehydroquinate synthase [Limnothrix sp. FACHB-1088]MBD2635130.1 3-dehydroquinate synthase [Limnothrix sp. FACHB-881]
MAATIRVNLPQNAYDIAIGAGLLDHVGDWMRERSTQTNPKVLLVSNPQIFKRYGDRVIASLRAAGYQVQSCILPAGERYKTPSSLQKIYDAALDFRLERSSVMLALGGGVIGDMTGFAAATWLRGIAFVQVPTSLLAMVDAAIGGKTGINHPRGKNLIGAFHQPRLVLIDPEVLATLPVRELRAGMAEVIKYGIIWDPDLFDRLEAAPRLDRFAAIQPLLGEILQRSCQAKADVVAQDEKEGGLRAILNYGHTIGHAIESLTNYRLVNHGEAVAIGMVAAAELAAKMGLWDGGNCARQLAVIQKTALPDRVPASLDPEAIADSLLLDKKVKDGKVRFILPTRIGAVEMVDQVPADVLYPVLRALQG